MWKKIITLEFTAPEESMLPNDINDLFNGPLPISWFGNEVKIKSENIEIKEN